MSATASTSVRLRPIDPAARPITRRRALVAVAPAWVPAPRFPFLTLISMILIGGVVGLLMFNTSLQQASFAATALSEQASTLAQREQTLQMELQNLRDPQRVAEHARSLGMVPVGGAGFLRLSDGAFLGRPAPATAAGAYDIAEPGYRPPPAAYVAPPRSADTAAASANRQGAQGRTVNHTRHTKNNRHNNNSSNGGNQ